MPENPVTTRVCGTSEKLETGRAYTHQSIFDKAESIYIIPQYVSIPGRPPYPPSPATPAPWRRLARRKETIYPLEKIITKNIRFSGLKYLSKIVDLFKKTRGSMKIYLSKHINVTKLLQKSSAYAEKGREYETISSK